MFFEGIGWVYEWTIYISETIFDLELIVKLKYLYFI